MTDGDHFAAAALTGLIANPKNDDTTADTIRFWAWNWADAMLREREQTDHDAAPAARAEDVLKEPTGRFGGEPAGEPEGTVRTGDTQEPVLEAEIERLREAIRRLADQDATLSVCNGGVTVTMDGTLDGWIPVAERLPIERQHVLVWRAGAPWPDRAVLHNGKWQIASRSWLYTRVTHWMNFPAPPSDGK
jgi:hypothetical protein